MSRYSTSSFRFSNQSQRSSSSSLVKLNRADCSLIFRRSTGTSESVLLKQSRGSNPNTRHSNASLLKKSPKNRLSRYINTESKTKGESTGKRFKPANTFINSHSTGKTRLRIARSECGSAENPNLSKRKRMEDTYKIVRGFNKDRRQTLLTLFDGHGGAECATVVRDRLPGLISQFSRGDARKALSQAFKAMNSALEKEGFEWSGSTATVALLKDKLARELIVANVGDSRAVLVRKDKSVERVSYDHKGTDHKEAEQIWQSGGRIMFGRVNGQLAVTRAFGDFAFKNQGVTATPSIYKRFVTSQDKLLIIASDGLWDVVEEEEIPKIVNFSQSPTQMASNLVKEATKRGSRDNISCIVLILN